MAHLNEKSHAQNGRVAACAVALLCGVLFAAGLVCSGMTQPARVIGFLNLAGMAKGPFPGEWDPSLAFVMGGAVLVTVLGFAFSQRVGSKPWLAERFVLPEQNKVDLSLVGGAALFGVGWGLAGYCPGPALASLLTGSADALIFSAAMLVGMWLMRKLQRAANQL
jgi:uncharacterized protein